MTRRNKQAMTRKGDIHAGWGDEEKNHISIRKHEKWWNHNFISTQMEEKYTKIDENV